MWVNTELYREAAKDYLRQGYYCPDVPGSAAYHAYWSEQLTRCIEGYSVGGKPITGDHYKYLNFDRIKLTDSKRGDGVLKKRTQSKIISFPDFWDGDAIYYQKLQEAEEVGKHLMVAKARRKGYSLKNASKATNTYNTVRNSLTLLCAHDKKYLYPQGIMTMAVDGLEFLNGSTGWAKRRQVVNKTDIVKASYLEYMGGQPVEKGYKSVIQSLTFKDNPDAARGKDARLIIFEEAGSFDNLKGSYMATRPCVEDGGQTTGIIIIFGTGGDMEGGTIDFESMYFDPDTYNLLPIENQWDEGGEGTFCSLFVPSYLNKVGYMDDQGNSLIKEAKAVEEAERERIKRTAKDAGVYDKLTTEYPWYPRESFQQKLGNIFPTATLQEHRNRVVREGLDKKLGVAGYLVDAEGRVKFRPSQSARPVDRYPHDKTGDTTGAVVIYQSPYRETGDEIPEGLYYVEHDPYAQDGGTGGSLGATYVKKRLNPYSKPDDLIVAEYVGRPQLQDDYNENLFLLARYYNARIGFENDRGNVIPYAKQHRLIRWLDEEPELLDKASGFRIKRTGRKYGCSMGSEERKGQAEIYLRDWLLTKRGKSENGDEQLNLHLIYSVALLDELIKYNRRGNFDRVSALLIGQLFHRANYQKQLAQIEEEADDTSFFNRSHYQ